MVTNELNLLDIDLIFALAGAEGEDGGGGDSGGDGGDGDGGGADGADGSDDGLTEGGRKAIEAERAASKRSREALKPWSAIRREFGLTPEQVRERLSAKSEGNEQDAEVIRREAMAEATKKANTRIARAEVRGLAASSFQDADDALLYIDLDEVEVDEDGNVDTEGVKRALADVLKRKPHLAKAKQKNGDFDGGTRTPPPPTTGMNGFIRGARRSASR